MWPIATVTFNNHTKLQNDVFKPYTKLLEQGDNNINNTVRNIILYLHCLQNDQVSLNRIQNYMDILYFLRTTLRCLSRHEY